MPTFREFLDIPISIVVEETRTGNSWKAARKEVRIFDGVCYDAKTLFGAADVLDLIKNNSQSYRLCFYDPEQRKFWERTGEVVTATRGGVMRLQVKEPFTGYPATPFIEDEYLISVEETSGAVLYQEGQRWVEAVVDELHHRILPLSNAHTEHTGGGIWCLMLSTYYCDLIWGVEGETWGADIQDRQGNHLASLETKIKSTAPPEAVALWMARLDPACPVR